MNFSAIVHEENQGAFETNFKRVQRIAKKLNLGDASSTFVKEILVKKGEHLEKKFVYEISMPELKISGWKFTAKIEHTLEGNIMRSIGDDDVPHRYRDFCGCEHCGIDRRRNAVYVVKNSATGEFKAVGSSCLKDFLGHDINLTGLSNLFEIEEQFYDLEESFGGSDNPAHWYFNTNTIIKLSMVLIKKYGYAKSDSDDSTKHKLSMLFMKTAREDVNAWIREINTEAHKIDDNKVDEFKNYINDMNSSTDYVHNLKVYMSAACVNMKSFGYIASAVAKFLQGNTANSDINKPAVSEYIANVGDNISVSVTLINKFQFFTQWGESTLLIMKDDSGNVVIWKKSGYSDLEIGSKFIISGRVKELDEYNGVKQTKLTRCKIS